MDEIKGLRKCQHIEGGNRRKDKGILKGIGSILLAIVASSHHWVHTLLIALGLTTLGTGLLSISPTSKLIFILISLVVSMWMIFVAIKKWNHNRPAAWVYLISSIISIILVATAIPKIYVDNNQLPPPQEPQHQIHHS